MIKQRFTFLLKGSFLFPVGGIQQTAIQREKYRWNYVSSRGKDRSLKNLESAVSLFPYPLQLKMSLMTEIKKYD